MRKQRGVTMIGWIFLLIPVAVVLYAGIRVAPEYLNYYKVVTALKETASQLKGDETLSPRPSGARSRSASTRATSMSPRSRRSSSSKGEAGAGR